MQQPAAELAPEVAAQAEGTVDPHAHHHGAGSSHMDAMAKTREGLRELLGPTYDEPVDGLDTADLDQGKALFEQHCASCHGQNGKGDGPASAGLNPPPSDFTDVFHARYYSDAGRMQIIAKGSPGTSMVGWEQTLSPAELRATYAWVRKFREAP